MFWRSKLASQIRRYYLLLVKYFHSHFFFILIRFFINQRLPLCYCIFSAVLLVLLSSAVEFLPAGLPIWLPVSNLCLCEFSEGRTIELLPNLLPSGLTNCFRETSPGLAFGLPFSRGTPQTGRFQLFPGAIPRRCWLHHDKAPPPSPLMLLIQMTITVVNMKMLQEDWPIWADCEKVQIPLRIGDQFWD